MYRKRRAAFRKRVPRPSFAYDTNFLRIGCKMLEFKNVSYKADDGYEILDDISFKIGSGLVAVTGPNGSGKSTVARLISGIIKPTSGRIFFRGEDITDAGITERAGMGISFGFQQPVRFKGITVYDLLSLAAGKNLTERDACKYLSAVGLCTKDYIDREANASLSGGELKRIEIAMIVARSTVFSVFDEPEAGIDLWSFNNLINIFKKLYDDTKGSVVIISHQERILKQAERIIVIADGRIQADGEGREVFKELANPSGCRFYTGGKV